MFRILLIEDDQQLRRALRLILEKTGYAVMEASNGGKGLALYKETPCDLVVTDIIMPKVEGVETILALRELCSTLPIIAISGGGRMSPECYLSTAKHFGANVVLEKPFELEELSNAVAELLARKVTSIPSDQR